MGVPQYPLRMINYFVTQTYLNHVARIHQAAPSLSHLLAA